MIAIFSLFTLLLLLGVTSLKSNFVAVHFTALFVLGIGVLSLILHFTGCFHE